MGGKHDVDTQSIGLAQSWQSVYSYSSAVKHCFLPGLCEVCNAERAQASAGALQAVHATGSGGLHTQHVIHCTSHLPYNRQVAPATTGPGALTGAGHMLNGKTQGVQAIHTSGMYS